MRLSHRVSAVAALAIALAPLTPLQADPGPRATVPLTMARTLRLASGHTARFSFPATHVALSWRGRAGSISYRVNRSDGGRSHWARAHEDDTFGTDGRHFTGVLAIGRASGLEWRRAGSRSVRVVKVHYMNTLDGPRRTRSTASAARAGAGFDIVTRAEWGANESIKRTRGGCRRSFYPVQQLFVHHTAGSNFDRHPEATMRAIYYFHTVTRGWCDVGYNFVIAPRGRIFEGRWARSYARGEIHDSEDPAGRAVRGAHVADFNSGSVGVSLMGNYSEVAMSGAMRTSLVKVLAWQAARHKLDPLGAHTYVNPETGLRKRLHVIAGHRDAGQTACPGGTVVRAMRRIRAQVAAEVARRARSRTSLRVAPATVTFGARVEISGQVRTGTGAPVTGQSVGVYRRLRRWRRLDRAATGGEGTFSSSFVPRRSIVVAAEFQGARQTWGSNARALRVRVRPRLSRGAVGGRVVDGVVHYPLDTARVPLAGRIAPPKPGARVTVKVFFRRSDGRYALVQRGRPVVRSDRSYRFVFRPRPATRPRAFRAVTWFGGDRRHAVGRSRSLLFEIGG